MGRKREHLGVNTVGDHLSHLGWKLIKIWTKAMVEMREKSIRLGDSFNTMGEGQGNAKDDS